MTLQSFYSRGKLMITAEYLVLAGAESLAIPVNFGQKLHVRPTRNKSVITWKTYVKNEVWQETRFENFKIEFASNETSARFLLSLLESAKQLNPSLFETHGFALVSDIDFDISWGLGSSSSLISNVAYWSNSDPFILHSMVSKGSGYDIACARANKPILYRLLSGEPVYREVAFRPSISGNIYFVYLGKKKTTEREVVSFLDQTSDLSKEVSLINQISEKFLKCDNYEEFSSLMREHEAIISSVLQVPPIKQQLFSDFQGEVKSLGAWGGDFAMVLWPGKSRDLETYMLSRGYTTLMPFNEMIFYNGIK